MTQPLSFTPTVQPAIVAEHVEEAVSLRMVRATLVRAPHVDLPALARADARLAAHLDGCAVAGEVGMRLAMAALQSAPGVGECFVVAVRALETGDATLLAGLQARCAQEPALFKGLGSALGWVSAASLKGLVAPMLAAQAPSVRAWGLMACAMHRVAPGPALRRAAQDADGRLRAIAWQAAASLGACELAEVARDAVQAQAALSGPPEPASRAAARALTLWGEGGSDAVRRLLVLPDAGQSLPPESTHRLAILASPLDWGRDEVRRLGASPELGMQGHRRMLKVAGWLGDPQIVPWLIQRMADPAWARLAAEAFSLITGADLDAEGLFQARPQEAEVGPSEDPDDADVALDDDEGLPWPDVKKIASWWQAHAARFAAGQPHLVGAPPSVAHCHEVLCSKGQRQRVMAAEHLCLLQAGKGQAGKGLFPVAAPAWRQQRWLAEVAPQALAQARHGGAALLSTAAAAASP